MVIRNWKLGRIAPCLSLNILSREEKHIQYGGMICRCACKHCPHHKIEIRLFVAATLKII